MTAISAEPISIEIQPPSSNLIRLATRNVISIVRNSAVSKMTATMDTLREYKYAAISTVDISIVSVTANPKAAFLFVPEVQPHRLADQGEAAADQRLTGDDRRQRRDDDP